MIGAILSTVCNFSLKQRKSDTHKHDIMPKGEIRERKRESLVRNFEFHEPLWHHLLFQTGSNLRMHHCGTKLTLKLTLVTPREPFKLSRQYR